MHALRTHGHVLRAHIPQKRDWAHAPGTPADVLEEDHDAVGVVAHLLDLLDIPAQRGRRGDERPDGVVGLQHFLPPLQNGALVRLAPRARARALRTSSLRGCLGLRPLPRRVGPQELDVEDALVDDDLVERPRVVELSEKNSACGVLGRAEVVDEHHRRLLLVVRSQDAVTVYPPKSSKNGRCGFSSSVGSSKIKIWTSTRYKAN